MTPNLGGWIHSFTVTDTQTHKGGYTLYKITSIIFPRSVPQALTQIVVWRRFHDIKRLHRDLKRRHKSLQLPGYLPEPVDCSFFKRFDKDIIQKRKEYILQLLDFAAQHTALYKCHAFAQFFNETPPPNNIQSFIHTAVAGLNINVEKLQDQIDFASEEYDNIKKPISDSKLLTEHKKLQFEEKVYNADEKVPDKRKEDEEESLKIEYISNVNDHSKHLLTSITSVESNDNDYIYEAALEFSHAVQAEANLKYTEAHFRYKRGVDILLYGSKDDDNDERKFIAKAKISKYLTRAEDIHERFIKTPSKTVSSLKNNFQLSLDVSGNTAIDSAGLYLERPWSHMAKYKINCLLDNKVLHVTCITEPLKPCYIMKGIEKPSSNSPTQTVFLPQHVPYMVDLLAFFQSDHKIFLLLKLAVGGKLIDFVHSLNNSEMKDTFLSSQRHYEVNVISSPSNKPVDDAQDVNILVNNSKQLMQSVSNTLQAIKYLESPKKSSISSLDVTARKISHDRKNTECQFRMWAEQLIIVIQTLHEKGVILSDLHTDNLLLNENGQLLLTYFYQNEGVSSDSSIHKPLSLKALEGHFVAPERPLTFRSDWWSYGVILYELFLGLPFKAAHPGQIDLYGFVQYPENAEISDTARDLLENLLKQIPEDRLNYEQIKQHRFFDGTNWEEVKQNGYTSFIQK